MNRIDVLSLDQSATLREAMIAIDRGACEIALVVDPERRLLGTLSDGDVRRALLGGATLSDSVRAFTNRRFTAVTRATSRADVLDLMRARFLQQIPVLDDSGRLIGLHLMREMLGAGRRDNWAVVMAGGRGQRLRPLTDTMPKPMVKVAGRPILERIVLHLVGFGVRRVFVSVNYMAQVIEEHLGDGSALGCRIEYLREDKPLGTGGALSLLPEPPSLPLLVLNGDLITQFDVGQMFDFHAAGGYAATMAVHHYAHTVPFGVVETDAGRICGLREKPLHSWLVNAGIYVFQPEVVGRVPPNTAYALPALVEESLSRSEPVGAFHLDGEWLDIGRHEQLRRARGEE